MSSRVVFECFAFCVTLRYPSEFRADVMCVASNREPRVAIEMIALRRSSLMAGRGGCVALTSIRARAQSDMDRRRRVARGAQGSGLSSRRLRYYAAPRRILRRLTDYRLLVQQSLSQVIDGYHPSFSAGRDR
ncbi:hypothetical protein B4U78_014655 [Microbacterium esteraromaticum]|nr:hypothetical protein B4U78_014655 [Microbacterium esteraromaticum]